MAENTKTRMRLGTISDFKNSEDVMKSHQETKEKILAELINLIDESEGLTLQKINTDIKAIASKALGRAIVINSGIALLLSGNPVVWAIGGVILGYCIIAGAGVYQIVCNKKSAERIKNIHERLKTQLEKYTESQNMVFRELDLYDVFDAKLDFTDNLKKVEEIVLNAEKRAKVDFPHIEEFFYKLKRAYKKLGDMEKKSFTTDDLIVSGKAFLAGVSAKSTDMSTAVGSVVADTVSTAVGSVPVPTVETWWETIHGMNIILNTGFLFMHIKDLYLLSRMKSDWKDGRKEEVWKNSKFKQFKDMRDLIMAIRDEIIRGY